MVGEVELALDGAELAGRALLRDDVYADVADVSFLRELVPHPDVGEALGIHGVELQVAADEAFERSPSSRLEARSSRNRARMVWMVCFMAGVGVMCAGREDSGFR